MPKRKQGRRLFAYIETWNRPVDKFRLHTWFDIKNRRPMYGVQVRQIGGRHFAHVIKESGRPILFEDQAKALAFGEEFLRAHAFMEVAHAEA